MYSKAQASKMIESGGSFGSWLANLGKKALTNVDIPLTRDNLPGSVSNLASNAVNSFERKISAEGPVRAEKRFNLYILNEDINDIIKIIKSDDSNVLNDGITKTVKREIKS